jgi:hypothetical protein
MFSYHLNLTVDDALLTLRGKVSIFPRILQILQRFEDFHNLFANIPITTNHILSICAVSSLFTESSDGQTQDTEHWAENMTQETFLNVSSGKCSA